MRTSVFVLLAVVVGYFAYNLWFAPEETGEEPVRLEAAPSEQPVEEPPPPEEKTPHGLVIRPELDLDAGGDAPAETEPALDKREQAAWSRFAELQEARKAKEDAKAAKLEALLLSNYPDTDAGRMLSFEKGVQARNRWKRLGRSPEGLRAAHEARRLMTPALFLKEGVNPAKHEELRDLLRQLADVVLFGSGKVEGAVHNYKVRSGDALSKLCHKVFPKRYGVHAEPGLIMEMNGLRRPQDLKADVHIRVPAGKPTLVVVKREFRLYYLLDGAYVRDWPVGLGAAGSTPVGEFTIQTKIENPDWFPKQGVKIKHGDPRNILGSRWMGFRDTPGLTGYGIHGTTLPDSIGREESSGCIRMQRRDVEELFSWTPRGTRVEIVR